MVNNQLALLLYKAISKILEDKELSHNQRIAKLFEAFEFIISQIIEEEKLFFASFFSKLSYASTKLDIKGKLLYLSHLCRKINSEEKQSFTPQLEEKVLVFVLTQWITISSKEPIPSFLIVKNNEIADAFVKRRRQGFSKLVKVFFLDSSDDHSTIKCVEESDPQNERIVLFNQPDLNVDLNPIVKSLVKYFNFPLKIHLIDVDINDNHDFIPRNIIIDPDYLIDVTSISESFKGNGTTTLGYLSRKLITTENGIPLLIGNISNFFLDELIYNPALKFSDVVPSIFQRSPLAFLAFSDLEIREIIMKSKMHFINIKKAVTQNMPKLNINAENAYVEPSFYSSIYGIQGRLDLFHINEKTGQFDIVELKSGKPYRANSYGLNANHYIQTLLYYAIVENQNSSKVNIAPYILYSSQDIDSIKYAPNLKVKQNEAIQIRNRIRILDEAILNMDIQDENNFIQSLDINKIPKSWSFVRRDIGAIINAFKGLDSVEKKYYLSFLKMITQERLIAKKGQQYTERNRGFSALWNRSLQDKMLDFSTIQFLEIIENNGDQSDPIIKLKRSKRSNRLAKFRKGDIAVFRAHIDEPEVLDNQIFKCSILDITKTEVSVRLRAQQRNLKIFKASKYWHLEPDLLDSSFNAMYRNMHNFAQLKKRQRQLLLGILPPQKPLKDKKWKLDDLEENQHTIIQKALNAEDYYLIWGPPGTGKTSKAFASMVKALFYETDENLLLLGFTNRAVDEICFALEVIDQNLIHNIIRFGSRYSTNPRFSDRLFDNLNAGITDRKGLHSLLESNRIIVSTVASLSSKQSILSLKKFGTIIIDEASQILEPMLIGILGRGKRWIMIGDHKQLPAVSAVPDDWRKVQDPSLLDSYHLRNLGESLFERLLRVNKKNGWLHGFGGLTKQGRMHVDIMQFVNKHFYENVLEPFNSVHRLVKELPVIESSILPNKRMIFCPVKDQTDIVGKGSKLEAKRCVDILIELALWYKQQALDFSKIQVGIITPFRLQISYITEQLENHKISMDHIQVDTVERFQGGAKDIVIYSCGVKHRRHLLQMINKTEEGIDRKLNVAITRAKERFFLIGNEEVLMTDENYASLIRYSTKMKFENMSTI